MAHRYQALNDGPDDADDLLLRDAFVRPSGTLEQERQLTGFSRGTATPPPETSRGGSFGGVRDADDDDPVLFLGSAASAPASASYTAAPAPRPARPPPPATRAAVADPHSGASDRPRPLTFAGGMLPDDFLRLTVPVSVPVAHPAAPPTLGAQPGPGLPPGTASGAIIMQVVQAKLAKNYGLTRMDPFCRFQLGRFERHTAACANGGKEPAWHEQVRLDYEPLGGTELHIEVLDMGTFSDKLVAWGKIDLTPVLAGVQVDEWFPLSGKQGDDKEGAIHIRALFQPLLPAYSPYPDPVMMMLQPQLQQQLHQQGLYPPSPVVGGNTYVAVPTSAMNRPQPYQLAPAPVPPPPQRAVVSAQDVRQVKEMFPGFDDETITAILVANQGNVEAAINALLSMS